MNPDQWDRTDARTALQAEYDDCTERLQRQYFDALETLLHAAERDYRSLGYALNVSTHGKTATACKERLEAHRALTPGQWLLKRDNVLDILRGL